VSDRHPLAAMELIFGFSIPWPVREDAEYPSTGAVSRTFRTLLAVPRPRPAPIPGPAGRRQRLDGTSLTESPRASRTPTTLSALVALRASPDPTSAGLRPVKQTRELRRVPGPPGQR